MLPRMQAPPCVRGRAASARRRPPAFAPNRLLAAPLVVAALVAAGSASGAVPVTASQTAAARAPQTSIRAHGITRMYGLETQVLAAINDLRRARGVVPLRLSPALAAAASQHSLSMAEHGYFEHASLDGSPLSKRVKAAYPKKARRWTLGENLAWASPGMSARLALRLWLASSRHRANLLSPAWRQIGLGAVHALVGGVYAGRNVTILTADFGVRRS
jgi:uncharacterized protein YkwD